MASFSSYVQDKLYNELFSCAKRFLQENGSKFDFGSSLHRAGYSRLEDISVRHTKVEDLPGCRIKFDVYLELEVVTQEGNHHYDDYEDDVKIEKSTPKYLAFVKSKKNSVHYIV